MPVAPAPAVLNASSPGLPAAQATERLTARVRRVSRNCRSWPSGVLDFELRPSRFDMPSRFLPTPPPTPHWPTPPIQSHDRRSLTPRHRRGHWAGSFLGVYTDSITSCSEGTVRPVRGWVASHSAPSEACRWLRSATSISNSCRATSTSPL